MLIPLSWLAEYVDLPELAGPHEVAADLVKVGLEEESMIESDITGPLVVGKVLTKEPEPQKNGKVVNWCSLDVGRGDDDPQWIVCGAHNFEVGDFVVAALPGAVLPGNFAISPRKTYGHVSAGMMCSSAELGLGEGGDGIITLGAWGIHDVAPGTDALPLLGLTGRDAQVVELNITPDRGYCFSVRGIAREYVHARGLSVSKDFRDPMFVSAPDPTDTGFPVTLDDVDPQLEIPGCSRFVTRVVRGIDMTKESPLWLKRRLTLAGMRPISLVVDVTNYVMLAVGQPMHAYDLATVDAEHGLTVRRARSGETIKTLDGQDRTLHPQDLLICDGPEGARAVGIAGVMGGAATEVSASTTDVLIESAWFDPLSVSRSARRHKLPSEASKRFERGVDTHIQAKAAQLVVDLLVKYGGGKDSGRVTDEGMPRPGLAFDIDAQQPGRIAGVYYPHDEVVRILEEIGCSVEDRDDRLTVRPPSWRPDLACTEDLTEEIARIHGYDNIPSVLPQARHGRGLTHAQAVRRRVASTCASLGLTEVMALPFVGADCFDDLQCAPDDGRRKALRLANPLNTEQPLMRPELLCSLPETVTRNVARGHEDVAIFEMSRVVVPPTEALTAPILGVDDKPSAQELEDLLAQIPAQPLHLAGILTGQWVPAGWQGDGRAADWADAVAIVRQLCDMLRVEVTVEAAQYAPWHPGQCARFFVAGELLGHAGALHPKAVEALQLPEGAVAFEINVDVLVQASQARVLPEPLSTFGVVKEDIALIVDDSVTAADVEAALREGGGALLESVKLFDVYTGDKLGDGKRSLAFALRMRAPNRTMNAQESAQVRGAAVAVAEHRFEAVLRDK